MNRQFLHSHCIVEKCWPVLSSIIHRGIRPLKIFVIVDLGLVPLPGERPHREVYTLMLTGSWKGFSNSQPSQWRVAVMVVTWMNTESKLMLIRWVMCSFGSVFGQRLQTGCLRCLFDWISGENFYWNKILNGNISLWELEYVWKFNIEYSVHKLVYTGWILYIYLNKKNWTKACSSIKTHCLSSN